MNLRIAVITPKGIEIEDEISSAIVPGEDGEIGILPGHCRYGGVLGTGILSVILRSDQSTQRMVVSGGFITVADGLLTVLADGADFEGGGDYSAERSKLSELIKGRSIDDPEFIRASQKLKRIQALERLTRH